MRTLYREAKGRSQKSDQIFDRQQEGFVEQFVRQMGPNPRIKKEIRRQRRFAPCRHQNNQSLRSVVNVHFHAFSIPLSILCYKSFQRICIIS